MTVKTRNQCKRCISQALLFKKRKRKFHSQLPNKTLPSNYPLRWITKHTVFAGNRFFYALSDKSYAMLFDCHATAMRPCGSAANTLIHHRTTKVVVRDVLADFTKVTKLLIENTQSIVHIMRPLFNETGPNVNFAKAILNNFILTEKRINLFP